MVTDGISSKCKHRILRQKKRVLMLKRAASAPIRLGALEQYKSVLSVRACFVCQINIKPRSEVRIGKRERGGDINLIKKGKFFPNFITITPNMYPPPWNSLVCDPPPRSWNFIVCAPDQAPCQQTSVNEHK